MFIQVAEFDVDDLQYINDESGLIASGNINGIPCEVYIPCTELYSEKIIQELKKEA